MVANGPKIRPYNLIGSEFRTKITVEKVFDSRISLTRVTGPNYFSLFERRSILSVYFTLDVRKNISVFSHFIKLKSTPFILFFYSRKKIRRDPKLFSNDRIFFAKLAGKSCQEIPSPEESGGYRGHSTET